MPTLNIYLIFLFIFFKNETRIFFTDQSFGTGKTVVSRYGAILQLSARACSLVPFGLRAYVQKKNRIRSVCLRVRLF